MPVYERIYRGYAGPTTPGWSRFTVLPRYAAREVFKSKLFIAFLATCLFFPLLTAVVIYIRHNIGVLDVFQNLGVTDLKEFIPIDASYYYNFLIFQGLVLGVLLTVHIGPMLISKDLANNALPLYLSRPFTRSEYVLGKASILAILLSAVTWVPAIGIYFLEGFLRDDGWWRENLSLLFGVTVGAIAWIVFATLLILAISAWVKWKPIASALFLTTVIVGHGFAFFVNQFFNTKWGYVFSVQAQIRSVWTWLLDDVASAPMSPAPAAFLLTVWLGICLLLLARKVRAYEVSV